MLNGRERDAERKLKGGEETNYDSYLLTMSSYSRYSFPGAFFLSFTGFIFKSSFLSLCHTLHDFHFRSCQFAMSASKEKKVECTFTSYGTLGETFLCRLLGAKDRKLALKDIKRMVENEDLVPLLILYSYFTRCWPLHTFHCLTHG